MDLTVVVRGNNELATTMLHRFTEVLGRTVRDQLLQLLPHFLGSFIHWLSFKMSATAPSITFNQLLDNAMRGITVTISCSGILRLIMKIYCH